MPADIHAVAPTLTLTVLLTAGCVKLAVVAVNADVPLAPAGPVEPVGPVLPGEPVKPVGPVGPVGPAVPGLPVGPVDPVGPVGPAVPCKPPGLIADPELMTTAGAALPTYPKFSRTATVPLVMDDTE